MIEHTCKQKLPTPEGSSNSARHNARFATDLSQWIAVNREMHFLGSVQVPVRAIHRCGTIEADLQVTDADSHTSSDAHQIWIGTSRMSWALWAHCRLVTLNGTLHEDPLSMPAKLPMLTPM